MTDIQVDATRMELQEKTFRAKTPFSVMDATRMELQKKTLVEDRNRAINFINRVLLRDYSANSEEEFWEIIGQGTVLVEVSSSLTGMFHTRELPSTPSKVNHFALAKNYGNFNKDCTILGIPAETKITLSDLQEKKGTSIVNCLLKLEDIASEKNITFKPPVKPAERLCLGPNSAVQESKRALLQAKQQQLQQMVIPKREPSKLTGDKIEIFEQQQQATPSSHNANNAALPTPISIKDPFASLQLNFDNNGKRKMSQSQIIESGCKGDLLQETIESNFNEEEQMDEDKFEQNENENEGFDNDNETIVVSMEQRVDLSSPKKEDMRDSMDFCSTIDEMSEEDTVGSNNSRRRSNSSELLEDLTGQPGSSRESPLKARLSKMRSDLAGSLKKKRQEEEDVLQERIKELELTYSLQQTAALKDSEKYKAAILLLKDQVSNLKATNRDQSLELNRSKETIERLETSLREERSKREDVNRLLESIAGELVSLRESKSQIKADIELATTQCSTDFGVLGEDLLNDIKKCQLEAEEAIEREKLLRDEHDDIIAQKNEFEELAKKATKDAEEWQRRLDKEETKRRKLFNDLQTLRGNIRVFCRVRPMLGKEVNNLQSVVKCPANDEVCVHSSRKTAGGKEIISKRTFTFDQVFDPKSSQQDVFKEVSPLVTSALDGFHVCIFAYGQTGSGKTYTMEGEPGNRGVNFNTLNELFRQREKRLNREEIKFKVSMVEIYNETVKDLLHDDAPQLDVRQGPKGIYLPGVTTEYVETMDDVENVMVTGHRNRSVAMTDCNEHSSRSHCLFMVDLEGKSLSDERSFHGRLVLVDLAGSERIAKSNVQGIKLKEAQNINKSLSALGDVISSLTAKNNHVPFRNSKLTYLLQDSLGKDNKALMIVQVSPVEPSAQETVCSLTFAQRVQTVELGKAKAHSDAGVDKIKGALSKAKSEAEEHQGNLKAITARYQAQRKELASLKENSGHSKGKIVAMETKLKKLQGELRKRDALVKDLEVSVLSNTIFIICKEFSPKDAQLSQ
eukprot:TRINITY_DN73399_c0_g2_i1.p1 TRINITY_DN73399_c0_g2~~TRINITY_DN73399_c0_g2_i1.p1  ORF type:complete len:1024 (-),score=349.87 TRINITY_DN73399_c0_g2_i1:25-3096(-)